GCGKKSAPASGQNGGPNAPAVVSAEKTSFSEVTSQLDPGGDFYLYLGTAQWLDNLSAKVGVWRQTFNSMPGLKPDDSARINKAFDIATRVIKDSGIEDVTGVGMSSIEIEAGMFRNKVFLHHYAGKDDGFLWKLAGGDPHPLTGIDFLSTNTALAAFSDTDLPLLWKVVNKEVAAADFPQAQQWLNMLPTQFERQTQIKWNDFLDSLGGEFGLVVTLDPDNNLSVPLPGGAMQIPQPGLMLVVKVNDDTIFNRIDQALKSAPNVSRANLADLKMRTLRVPVPLIGELHPAAASSGGYLFIASDDSLIRDAVAVKSGKQSGLKSTDEFKRLSQGIPDRGNQFVFVSQRFAGTMMKVQQQAMAANAKSQPAMTQWLQSIYRSRPAFAYSVSVNEPEGCLTVANSSQSYASTALLAPVAAVGMLSAIAIPNFVKARSTSQQNACINNLRQIDAAKNEWALEKHKTATDVPTKENLLPYLRSWPVCPDGGTYTIGAVGEKPTCSIPGHKLP
ncbi:MAG TPA: hypothetical protein VFY06_11995, partial [Verrucomicrobiae bacterium]|nr:hypothetical protein [Verrucomicrobiae bacterium]